VIPYKDDNPSRTFPFATIAIIVLNISIFILQIMSGESGKYLVYAFGAIPSSILHFTSAQPIPAVLTVFTSMFMHGGILHIAGNMLYFWIFGDNIEDRLGHLRFVFFYLFCGIIAAYSNAIMSSHSQIPMIGASGAISGILGAYALLFPRARVHTLVFFGFFITVVRIPSLIVIGFWAIIQLVSGLLSEGQIAQGGVAWFAHVGGFTAGLLTIKLWMPRRIRKW
jgi:membrane associated rhomboid family serine protease